MEKEFVYSSLNAIYGGLLTEKQREVIELYYSCDLSLAEIAEIKKTTRNSVLDLIENAKKHLDRFENELKILQTKAKVSSLLDEAETKLELEQKIKEIMEI